MPATNVSANLQINPLAKMPTNLLTNLLKNLSDPAAKLFSGLAQKRQNARHSRAICAHAKFCTFAKNSRAFAQNVVYENIFLSNLNRIFQHGNGWAVVWHLCHYAFFCRLLSAPPKIKREQQKQPANKGGG